MSTRTCTHLNSHRLDASREGLRGGCRWSLRCVTRTGEEPAKEQKAREAEEVVCLRHRALTERQPCGRLLSLSPPSPTPAQTRQGPTSRRRRRHFKRSDARWE